jgi:hypothetical protein
MEFSWTGYNSQRKSKFISITSNAGNCDPVLRPVSGTYLASTNGEWEGAVGFKYNQALFEFQFFNMYQTQEEYQNGINYAKNVIVEYLGNYSTSYNLAMMILVLTTYQLIFPISGSNQYVLFTGSPNVIFNAVDYYGGMASSSATCYPPAAHTFDSNSAVMSISVGYSDFVTYCPAFDPFLFGFLDNDIIVLLQIDMRSFVMAMGTNMGIPGAALSLEVVEFSQFVIDLYQTSIEVDGMVFEAVQYYSIRYPGMEPFVCVISTNSIIFSASTPLCFMELSGFYGIPIMNPVGISGDEPSPCNCSEPELGTLSYCNAFSLLYGLILNTNATTTHQGYAEQNTLLGMIPLIQLAQRYATAYGNWSEGMFHLNEDAYVAQLGVATSNSTASWAEGSMEFCGFDCTILGIKSTDYFNQAISDNYYQLYNGSCSNSINMSGW